MLRLNGDLASTARRLRAPAAHAAPESARDRSAAARRPGVAELENQRENQRKV
jgi:hypothetical protein